MKKGFIALFSMLGIDTSALEASADKVAVTEEQLTEALGKAESLKSATDSAKADLAAKAEALAKAEAELKSKEEALAKATADLKAKEEALTTTTATLDKYKEVHGSIDPTGTGKSSEEAGAGVPAHVDMNASHNKYFKELGIL
jgi:colicin import membrane protein